MLDAVNGSVKSNTKLYIYFILKFYHTKHKKKGLIRPILIKYNY